MLRSARKPNRTRPMRSVMPRIETRYAAFVLLMFNRLAWSGRITYNVGYPENISMTEKAYRRKTAFLNSVKSSSFMKLGADAAQHEQVSFLLSVPLTAFRSSFDGPLLPCECP